MFDLDGTLTRRDTFLPYLLSYGRRYRRLRGLLTCPFPIGLYAIRWLSDRAAKERLLVSFLGGQSEDWIAEHTRWFCEQWLPQQLNRLVIDRLREHQHRGHQTVLLSASPSVYVPAIGHWLGIEQVICTRVAARNGVCTGQIVGENCKGAAKLAALQRFLGATDAPAESSAYGDSPHDRPVLQWVAHGYFVSGRSITLVPSLQTGGASRAQH